METPLTCPSCRASQSFKVSFDETPDTWMIRCSVCRKLYRVMPLPELPPGVPPVPLPTTLHLVSPQSRKGAEELDKAVALNFELRFGKHSGKTLGDIQEEDEEYLVWLAEQSWVKKDKPSLFRALGELGYSGEE